MDPLYTALEGHILLNGYAPDGDSVRFLPNDAARLGDLRRSSLIRTSPVSGSVQLRLEGVDAPELHYLSAAQPRGGSSRDALLEWLGVASAHVTYAADGSTIASSSADAEGGGVPVTVLAQSADPHGRVIAYVLRDPDRPPAERVRANAPRRRRVTADVVRASANHALVESGQAYFLAYASLPAEHRAVLRAAARAARAERRGVWSDDATARGFALKGGERALGPSGALIFPKLFRRCVDFFADRRTGFRGTFVEWLRTHGSSGGSKPDRVHLPHAANLPLASLIDVRGERFSLAADLTDLVFAET